MACIGYVETAHGYVKVEESALASCSRKLLSCIREGTPQEQFAALLRRELPLSQFLEKYPVPAMMDDRPGNEYCYLQHRRQLLFTASRRELPTTGSPLSVIQINGAKRQVNVGGDKHLYSRGSARAE